MHIFINNYMSAKNIFYFNEINPSISLTGTDLRLTVHQLGTHTPLNYSRAYTYLMFNTNYNLNMRRFIFIINIPFLFTTQIVMRTS